MTSQQCVEYQRTRTLYNWVVLFEWTLYKQNLSSKLTIPCGSLCYNCAEEGRICFRKPPPSNLPTHHSPLHLTPFIASRFSTPHVLLNNPKNRSHHRRYLWGKVKIEYGNTYSVFKTQVFRDVYSVSASTRLSTPRTRHRMTLPYSNSAVTTPTHAHFVPR